MNTAGIHRTHPLVVVGRETARQSVVASNSVPPFASGAARRAGRAATRLAVPLDHHLEVLARHHHRSIPRTIAALDQLE